MLRIVLDKAEMANGAENATGISLKGYVASETQDAKPKIVER